jgi:hypothetical protein
MLRGTVRADDTVILETVMFVAEILDTHILVRLILVADIFVAGYISRG